MSTHFSSERIEKYERYQCELSDPVYRVSSIKEMYAIYDISDSVEKGTKVYDMIVNESLQDVNIEGINKNDPTSRGLRWTLRFPVTVTWSFSILTVNIICWKKFK